MSSATYAPHGAPAEYRFGNDLWRVFNYNSRLQPDCSWDAVHNSPAFYLFSECPGWGGSNNNGNLQSVTVQTGGPGQLSTLPTFSTSYGYDGLNRLHTASDSGGWSRTFDYDQYGNMWTSASSGVPTSGLMPTSNVFTGANQIAGGTYDAVGNQLLMGTYTLGYNAGNRLVTVTDAPAAGGGSAQYLYDASGQRVMKLFSNGGATYYIYDALGELAAEYSTNAEQRFVLSGSYGLPQWRDAPRTAGFLLNGWQLNTILNLAALVTTSAEIVVLNRRRRESARWRDFEATKLLMHPANRCLWDG